MAGNQLRIEPTIGPPISDLDWSDRRPASPDGPARPTFLAFVSILLLVSGIAGAFLYLGLWSELSDVAESIEFGADWPYAPVVMSIVTILAGMLLIAGGPVGWYLLAFLLIEGLVAGVYGWSLVREEGIPIAFLTGNTISWYTKIGLRTVLTLMMMAYLFTRPVRAYCDVGVIKGIIAIALIVGAEAVIYLTNA